MNPTPLMLASVTVTVVGSTVTGILDNRQEEKPVVEYDALHVIGPHGTKTTARSATHYINEFIEKDVAYSL
jgi:hypothetical protein